MARARILILEENRQVVDELRDNLELAGFETEVALTSPVAFTILEERKMDLAIVGGGQDLNVLKKLHELYPKLLILFLSEQKSKRYQASLLKAGASEILELPLDKDQAITKIEQILEKPEVPPPKIRLKKPSKKVSKKKRASSAS